MHNLLSFLCAWSACLSETISAGSGPRTLTHHAKTITQEWHDAWQNNHANICQLQLATCFSMVCRYQRKGPILWNPFWAGSRSSAGNIRKCKTFPHEKLECCWAANCAWQLFQGVWPFIKDESAEAERFHGFSSAVDQSNSQFSRPACKRA